MPFIPPEVDVFRSDTIAFLESTIPNARPLLVFIAVAGIIYLVYRIKNSEFGEHSDWTIFGIIAFIGYIISGNILIIPLLGIVATFFYYFTQHVLLKATQLTVGEKDLLKAFVPNSDEEEALDNALKQESKKKGAKGDVAGLEEELLAGEEHIQATEAELLQFERREGQAMNEQESRDGQMVDSETSSSTMTPQEYLPYLKNELSFTNENIRSLQAMILLEQQAQLSLNDSFGQQLQSLTQLEEQHIRKLLKGAGKETRGMLAAEKTILEKQLRSIIITSNPHNDPSILLQNSIAEQKREGILSNMRVIDSSLLRVEGLVAQETTILNTLRSTLSTMGGLLPKARTTFSTLLKGIDEEEELVRRELFTEQRHKQQQEIAIQQLSKNLNSSTPPSHALNIHLTLLQSLSLILFTRRQRHEQQLRGQESFKNFLNALQTVENTSLSLLPTLQQLSQTTEALDHESTLATLAISSGEVVATTEQQGELSELAGALPKLPTISQQVYQATLQQINQEINSIQSHIQNTQQKIEKLRTAIATTQQQIATTRQQPTPQQTTGMAA